MKPRMRQLSHHIRLTLEAPLQKMYTRPTPTELLQLQLLFPLFLRAPFLESYPMHTSTLIFLDFA